MTTTTETPEQRKVRYQIENMAKMIGRLAYRLRKLSPNDPVAEQALDFLKRNDMQGSPLRMDNGGSVMRSNASLS